MTLYDFVAHDRARVDEKRCSVSSSPCRCPNTCDLFTGLDRSGTLTQVGDLWLGKPYNPLHFIRAARRSPWNLLRLARRR